MNAIRRILCSTFLAPALGIAAPEQILPLDASSLRGPALSGVAYREQIVVVPEWSPAEKNRWQKFEEALGPGRSARRTVTSWRNNDGSRTECHSHCVINCCVESGRFSLTGAGFGGR